MRRTGGAQHVTRGREHLAHLLRWSLCPRRQLPEFWFVWLPDISSRTHSEPAYRVLSATQMQKPVHRGVPFGIQG